MSRPGADTGYNVYWGDFHKHISEPPSNLDRIDAALADAAQHLDVYPVLCYPFENRMKGTKWGIREETVRNRPKFLEWWRQIQRAVETNHQPGEFVTFPAYEWHGNRRQWGDHNVIHFQEGGDLDDAWRLPDLYENLRSLEMPALAIPHHTAYSVGERAKDWDTFDPDVSPVMEVYSTHGSSEGVGTPVPMDSNPSMGPRTSGGTFRDALSSGHHVGAIASNDGGGLPGSWGDGVAGLWAEELTREGIWDAITNRRTYGTTGDRINLWYALNGAPMGSTVEADDATASIAVACQQPLDRIELIHDGRVIRTHDHCGSWTRPEPDERTEYRVLVELGWGPNPDYGDWEQTQLDWEGEIDVVDGSLRAVQPRFNGWGQRYETDGQTCTFSMTTDRGDSNYETTQGFVLTLVGDYQTEISVDIAGYGRIVVPLAEAFDQTNVTALTDESYGRIEAEFDVSREDIVNPDVAYHNARKVKVHQAYPRTAYAATVEFDNLPVSPDEDYYYVRASQVDGQYAWSSPVWVV